MAGSRLDRVGTIFSRATGLIKAGAVKYDDRPLWYHIYRIFPPKYEPHIDRQAEKKEIMEIFYREDKFRALFFKRFGANPGGIPRNLSSRNFEEPSQPFVNSCLELLKKHPDWNDDQVFDAAADKYGASRILDMKNTVQHQLDSDDGYGVMGGDVMDEAHAAKRHGRKLPTGSAQSLLSMFQEAKAKEEQEKSTEETQSATKSKQANHRTIKLFLG